MFKRADSVKIPLEEVNFGIGLILDNVLGLVEDARLILRESRTAHVVGLLELAIQELGKAELLRKGFDEQLKERMTWAKEGKTITLRFVEIKGFYGHDIKHDAGVKLLSEYVTKVEQRKFWPFSEGGFVGKDVSISERLRLEDFYVDWENGKWKLPSPTMIFGDIPSEKLLVQLGALADAIEKATSKLHQREKMKEKKG